MFCSLEDAVIGKVIKLSFNNKDHILGLLYSNKVAGHSKGKKLSGHASGGLAKCIWRMYGVSLQYQWLYISEIEVFTLEKRLKPHAFYWNVDRIHIILIVRGGGAFFVQPYCCCDHHRCYSMSAFYEPRSRMTAILQIHQIEGEVSVCVSCLFASLFFPNLSPSLSPLFVQKSVAPSDYMPSILCYCNLSLGSSFLLCNE